MHYRIFSKKNNLYVDNHLWPSNQRSFSEWALRPSGEVVEIIYFSEEAPVIQAHDKRDFEVEAWTGFYDCQNKRIYLGDIIKLQCFNLDYEVAWSVDRFTMKPLFEHFGDAAPHCFRTQKDFSVDWRVTNTIHGVEYCY